ncbi:GABA permease, partial [Bacillus paralicheniformis]|nr:GABA permease [Bacillus paralicheniformis]
YATIISMISVLILMAFIDSQRPQFIFTMLFSLIVICSFFFIRRKKAKNLENELNIASGSPNSEKL